ncbi:MAG TPA: glutamate synthase large subunit [Pyrinomonadaceae bacterium]|nr:glutamate synthase large subunit [Pyrinomonadaceae bacterium]
MASSSTEETLGGDSEIEQPRAQGLYNPQYEHESCGVGFVADVKGRLSNNVVANALKVLASLGHRGASGSEQDTGDGAGILTQVPHEFLVNEFAKLSVVLPERGGYGVGVVFLPTSQTGREECEKILEAIANEEGLTVLGWRSVPTNDENIGPSARNSQPLIRQVILTSQEQKGSAFERKLYVVRRRVTSAVQRSHIAERSHFYIASLSQNTVVYKGMLRACQLPAFYPDLSASSYKSSLAVVHSRFSTNTFPSWPRAHPYRYIAHNGEINTLRGNINWMRARESSFQSQLFGEDLNKVLPIIDADASDSGMFDNVLEMLVLSGRSLPHALMMMVPEPWTENSAMSDERKAFYEYHSLLMEPWDGPAAIVFTDGFRIGAMLDRNGLRPARYYVTEDDTVVMASEVGVLDIAPEKVLAKGSIKPGQMFLVDTILGRTINDEELKHELQSALPYREWLEANTVHLDRLPAPPYVSNPQPDLTQTRHQLYGYTQEDLKTLIEPMALKGEEAIGSMGSDTALAVVSDRPQLLYNYFKQLFAQVTNPPVDGIRERLVMSVDTSIGPEANLLEPSAECARQIKIPSPVLTNEDIEKLRLLGDSDSAWGKNGFKSITLSILFEANRRGDGLRSALDDLSMRASSAIASGYDVIILSDRDAGPTMVPIPALLAVSAIHHHLIREGTRTQVGLIVESGEVREIHHFALLLGYGAAAVNPYLVFDTINLRVRDGSLPINARVAASNYVNAVNKGVIKVISKMGISTTQGYCGAQVFEAIGLSERLIDRYFTWTPSRIGGIDLDVISEEVAARHRRAFNEPDSSRRLDKGGEYSYRSDGPPHQYTPQVIHKLQRACREGNYQLFKEYSAAIHDSAHGFSNLRSLMEFDPRRRTIPIEEVESVAEIVKRFKTGAMSFGSISKESHESLAVAMNRLGGRSNTGEGGEDPARFSRDQNGDSRNSAIKQIASGRFGVTSNYLVHAKEIQIKIAQGAKPGEGGQIPGYKVYPWIAKVRHSTPGVGLISPPPHHDIYSIEDLAQLIYDLKNANPKARISVKLVSEVGIGTIAAGVAKARADVILISGYDGGTGAAPLTSIKHAGTPWELGLAETHQTLLLNDLRSRVSIETDGQLKTGRDVVIAGLLGAEEFGFATAPLIAMGCVMRRACHLNTCPVGIATQDPKLREKFKGEPEHVMNFMNFVAGEVRELMAQLGFRTFNELIGRSDCLIKRETDHWKAKNLDLSAIFYQPQIAEHVGRYRQYPQEHALDSTIDVTKLIPLSEPALTKAEAISETLKIANSDRSVGTRLGSEVTKRYGAVGLPDDTINLKFVGSAGQSFAAFIPKGITMTLEGDANDYIGKGLSGGKIIVRPPETASFQAEENVIVGNVSFYGATSGEAYINGVAGQRFCVRNSGANVVVEGIGDHGCEYMTGGRVVVLGEIGQNFAAGMSGGIAYLFGERETLLPLCNIEMVTLLPLDDEHEIETVRQLITKQAEYTGSRRATEISINWEASLPLIVKVLPNEYGRYLEEQGRPTYPLPELTDAADSKTAALSLSRAG